MQKDKYPSEKEDKLALIVENANTRVQEIINESIMFGWTKLYAKSLVMDLVNRTEIELKDNDASEYLIESTKIAILKAFMKQWLLVISILESKLNQDNLGFIGKLIKNMKTNEPLILQADKGITIDLFDDNVGIAKAGIKNLRDFMTGIEPTSKDSIITELGGTSRFVDYRTLLQNTLIEVKDNLANGTLTLTDSLGRVKSIRNMAEIETRYKMIAEDMRRQGVGLNEFVVSSSHADESERCHWWSSKIFLVDLDISSRPFGEYDPKNPPNPTPIGKIDGKDYYSLKVACDYGFLSYNCQHRLIKYYKGIQPIQYPQKLVQVKRDATIRQRQMENTIRHWKRKEKLSDRTLKVNRTNPITGQQEQFTEYEWNVLNSKLWQQKYRDFSKNNGLPIYEWRTRITEYESK